MKTGYVFIPHFAVALEQHRRPDLVGRALVVGGLPHERRTVFDASAEARKAGVSRGMTLRQAQYLCPEAIFLPLDPVHGERVQGDLLAAMEKVTPIVEPDGWGAAYLDAEGLEMLYGGDEGFARQVADVAREAVGLEARVAVGPNKLVVRIAARLAKEGRPIFVGPGQGSRFLESLPIERLSLAPETEERLRRLGIRTIGAFLRLPRSTLAERLGREALAVHRAATDNRTPVAGRLAAAELRRSLTPDFPLEDLVELRPRLEREGEAMAAQLRERGQVCRQVVLRLDYDDGHTAEGSVHLKEATAAGGDVQRALGILTERMQVSTNPTPTLPVNGEGDSSTPILRSREKREDVIAAEDRAQMATTVPPLTGGFRGVDVVQVEIVLRGLGPEQGKQLSLLQARLEEQRRRERLEQALAHLRRRYGDHVRRGERLKNGPGHLV